MKKLSEITTKEFLEFINTHWFPDKELLIESISKFKQNK